MGSQRQCNDYSLGATLVLHSINDWSPSILALFIVGSRSYLGVDELLLNSSRQLLPFFPFLH